MESEDEAARFCSSASDPDLGHQGPAEDEGGVAAKGVGVEAAFVNDSRPPRPNARSQIRAREHLMSVFEQRKKKGFLVM